MPKIQNSLNQNLADWSVIYFKLHHFHWYVKGPHFQTLHEKFEELYNFAALSLDEVAERILAIGGKPLSTMKDYLSQSNIKEGGDETKDVDMVKAVIDDFILLTNRLNETQEMAEEAGDAATADLLTQQIGTLQKHIWMLSATAGINVPTKVKA
ncbi:Dps family protein [Cohnella sp. JJ-181]|uniref:Dps family protein n=1 Tax=Cohnella rhizoplanae TaxID=2974897 RepID=UPI0022FFB821|nr:DNA starvation/stationary phase protection protein [Cohnella sp. JJ-181]CAI6081938.1 DNA protection during starvation protein 1 [Cohnella sp. JJ-181]